MTLEQSEFQKLVELMLELCEHHHGDPAALDAILSELKDLYKKIPIYPGIITMCLPKVVQPVEVDKLGVGDEVIFSLKDGQIVSGKVAEVNPKEIKLAESKQLNVSSLAEKVVVQKEAVGKAKRIMRDVIEKEWPTLDFEVE
ncbi:MAG: hypothetical protein QMD95_03805 [Candidatus Hodarchaeaceae archaeon]|nr:hypothetical protein [Candidatus Hodarchaeaceae archaeon]